MNILQVMGCTSVQYASMERYLVRKAQYCQKNGHTFHVIYDNKPQSEDFINDLQTYRGKLHKLKNHGMLDRKYYSALKQIIRKNHIDTVHAYFTPACHFVMWTCLFLGIKNRFRTSANLPYTLSKADRRHTFLFDRFFKSYQRLIIASVPRKTICRSNAIADEFKMMGVLSHKLAVSSGGTDINAYRHVDNARQELSRNFHIPKDSIVIGAASRLVPVKNIDALIRAITIVIESRKDIVLVIAGDGPERVKLNKVAEELAISKYVRFLGHRDDLPSLISAFDLFVQTSFAEGMSNSILEAMACEVPIVVSNIAPNMEIIEAAEKIGCYIGESFGASDLETMAKKILLLLERNDLKDIGRDCRRVVKELFSLDARIEKEFTIYGY